MISRLQRVERELAYRRAFRHDGTPQGMVEAFGYFCSTFASIKNVREPRGYSHFDLRDSQRETALALARGEHVIVLKARQIGFSTLFSQWALWDCLCNEAFDVLFLSRNEREAKRLLAMAKFSYRRLPQWLRNRLPVLKVSNETKMVWENDSVIESLPSLKDAARGYTSRLLIADEFASLQDQEEAWASMLAATDLGGQAVVLSTAKGAGDLFETLWNGAVTKANSFTPLFYSWMEVFDLTWYEEKRANTLPWILAQEHPTNAEEAFIRAGNAVFDYERIKEMVPVEPMHGDWIMETAHFKPGPQGPMSIWELPENGKKYAIGVDVAEGLEHGDRTVIMVLAVPEGDIVARWMGVMAPWQAATIGAQIGRFYNKALIGVERNNHGHAYLQTLVTAKYWPIYTQERKTKRRAEKTDQLGWLTTPASKADIISQLDEFMANKNLADAVLLGEMKTYVRDERGRMSGSPFDDNVMAMAIAVEMLTHVHEPQYKTSKMKVPVHSHAWYMALEEQQSRPTSKFGVRNLRQRAGRF